MAEDQAEDLARAHETIQRTKPRQGTQAQGSQPTRQEALGEQAAEAAYWRAKYQEERERLAKLWVAYKDVEAEMELRREDEDERIERKVEARLAELAAQASERGEEAEPAPGEQPSVLAIEPPQPFQAVCEAPDQEVKPGAGTSFPIVLVNRGDEEVDVTLTGGEVTEGFSVLITVDEVTLEPLSSRTLHIILRAPADAAPGTRAESKVSVQTAGAEPTEFTLRARVVEPRARQVDQAPEVEPVEEVEEAEVPVEVATEDDPFGDIHPVREVEGIGEAYTSKLHQLGIEDTRQLWHADTDEVARHLDLSPKVVTRWQQMVELIALPEIGPQYAELLVRSGIPSIQVLSEAEPEALLEAIEAKQGDLDVKIQGNVVRTGRVVRWINVARLHMGLAPIQAPELPAPETTEARASPFGDVDGITDVEGIGETYAEGLAELGIVDTPSLWHADTEAVAEHLDLSPKIVSRWQAQAELMAISGIGPQYAELLVRSGIPSIQALSEADADELLAALEEKQDELEVKIQGTTIGKGRVQGWIEMAREHSP